MKSRAWWILGGACAALLGCGRAPSRPTVVLVTLDTTRAENLSTYGYQRVTDPFLASLAERSRVFERAYSTTTWTLPSHVSMFTGLAPAEHGVWFRLEERDGRPAFPAVGDGQPLFTDALADEGYALVGAAGGPYMRAMYGLARHFDEWIEPASVERAGRGGEWQLSGAEINRRLFPLLRELTDDRPLFLFVNYFDAHAPYEPPQDRDYPFPLEGELPAPLDVDALPIPMPDMTQWVAQGREVLPEYEQLAEALYDQELLLQDEALAALWGELERLGRLEDALVIVTADHGEMFGEQPAAYGHSGRPWEPVTRVPLLVHRTGGPVDRIGGPVSIQQIAATVLDCLELPALPAPVGGECPSLLAVDPLPADVHAELHTPDDWTSALHRERTKLWSESLAGGLSLDPPRRFLIDLASDPDEAGWASARQDPAVAGHELASKLDRLRAGWASVPDRTALVELSDDDLRGLAAMGYVDAPAEGE